MTTTDPGDAPSSREEWGVADLDLEAYLRQIGEPPGPATPAALARLHRAHRRTFAFENLDVLLEQHPGVSVAAIQAKFGSGRRGGYCFEHATLFAAALDRLGYAVRRHLSRVGDPVTSPRTHLVCIVTVAQERLLCDVGMGWTLLEPIPLRDGAEVDQDGWRFRLVRRTGTGGEPLWELQRRHGERWEAVHWIDEGVVHEIDVQLAHHWTSTSPTTHFRSSLMATGFEGPRLLGISLDGITERMPGEPTRHHRLPERDDELAAALSRVGIRLRADELRRLGERLRALR